MQDVPFHVHAMVEGHVAAELYCVQRFADAMSTQDEPFQLQAMFGHNDGDAKLAQPVLAAQEVPFQRQPGTAAQVGWVL